MTMPTPATTPPRRRLLARGMGAYVGLPDRRQLCCEGRCGAGGTALYDRAASTGDRVAMRALARALVHTWHRRIRGSLFACETCGTVRRDLPGWWR